MFSLFRTLSLRYLLHHWARSGLVVLSIALGVATWVATDSLNRALDRSVRNAATPLGVADVYVTNTATLFVESSLSETIKRVPGVKRVEPVILETVTAALTEKDLATPKPDDPPRMEPRPCLLLGMNRPSAEDDSLANRGIEVADIDWLAFLVLAPANRETPVLVGQQMDEDLLKGKTSFVIQTGGKTHRVRRVGQVRASGAAATLGGYVLLTEWQMAARVLDRPGMVHRLDVTLDPESDREESVRQLKLALADRAEVQSDEERNERLSELKRGMESAFRLCGAGALVVGLFLVYNAMSVSVSERRHDIGILRSIGSTRPQIRFLFLAEALMMGLIGSGLGLPLGLAMATMSLGPMQHLLRGMYLPLDLREVETTTQMLLVATCCGMGTALLAALVPASKAAAEEPAEAVRRAPPVVGVAYRLLQLAGSGMLMVFGLLLSIFKSELSVEIVLQVCGVLLLLGIGLTLYGSRRLTGPDEHSPRASGVTLVVTGALLTLAGLVGFVARDSLTAGNMPLFLPAVLLFFGSLLAVPALAALAARSLVQPLAREFLPIPSRLAADNLVRSPGRTGLVIAAFTAMVALTVQTAGLIRSNREAFLEWVDNTVRADLYVASGGLASSTGQTRVMRPGVADDLQRELPPGSRIVGMTYRYVEWDPSANGAQPADATSESKTGTRIYMVLADATKYYEANAALPQPPAELVRWRELGSAPNQALVSENFAQIHGVRKGDWLTFKGRKGPIRLKIIGTLTDYNWIRGTVFIDRKYHQIEFGAEEVNTWEVYLPEGTSVEETRERLQKSSLASAHALMTMTRLELHDFWLDLITRVYGVTYTQELLVGLVAVLGVVMSLLISVLGRQRELGLLRAVGGTRTQLLHTVVAEGVLIGLVGTLLGILIGLPMEWFAVRVLLFEETGFLFPVRIPWMDAALIAVLSVLAATVASIGPAIHAMRLRITNAIAYE